MHTAPRSVQQQQQQEQEKQHDQAGAIAANQALDSNSSSTLSAARAPAERQQQQQQQHAHQRHASTGNGLSGESTQQYQPQSGPHRDGTAPASSPELVRSRRSGQQDRAMQDSFRFKYIDQQQPAAGSSTGASQVGGVAAQQQQQQHVVIGSTRAYEQPHAPNSYASKIDNGHSAYHMAVAASQSQPQPQPQLQQQQQQITFSVGTQTVYSSYSIAQVAPPQPTRYPATYTLAELCQSREFIMNRARTLGEQGGKRELRTTSRHAQPSFALPGLTLYSPVHRTGIHHDAISPPATRSRSIADQRHDVAALCARHDARRRDEAERFPHDLDHVGPVGQDGVDPERAARRALDRLFPPRFRPDPRRPRPARPDPRLVPPLGERRSHELGRPTAT
jgi:hypothetical protein